MEIKALGHSSFRFKTSTATVVTDPFDQQMVGLPFPKVAADIVTVSHQHKDHNATEKVVGTEGRPEPLIFDAPGEYEAQDVGVVGISTFHDDKEGKERGGNNIFVFQIEGLILAHLGDLGHPLTESQVEELGPIDVLFVPVGGVYSLNPAQATKLIADIGPSLVIPMHYKVPASPEEFSGLATVDEFIDKAEIATVRREDKLKVTKDTLPEETEIVVLSF